METFKLNYPFVIDGQTIKEISYDYADFKGADYFAAIGRRKGSVSQMVAPMNDYALHFALGVGIVLASNRGKGWTAEDFDRLAGSDLWQLTQIGLVFFAATPDAAPGDSSAAPSASTPSDSTSPGQTS